MLNGEGGCLARISFFLSALFVGLVPVFRWVGPLTVAEAVVAPDPEAVQCGNVPDEPLDQSVEPCVGLREGTYPKT